MSDPTISVVMPAYNEGRFIEQAIRSLLEQTVPPLEIVVVDDGSTDDTVAVVQGFGDAVRLIQQPNGGCPAAFNTGFRAARGEFVALAPADDVYAPTRIERQAAALAADPELDVVFSWARQFGITDEDYARPSGAGRLDTTQLVREMFVVNVIPDPSAVVRRSLHERLGGYREDIIGEDYEFWLRALAAGAVFHCVPEVLVDLRVHGGNLSRRALGIWQAVHATHVDHAALVGDDAFVARTLARDLVRIGAANVGLGDAAAARAAYGRSLRHRPSLHALAGTVALSLPGSAWAVRRRYERRAA